MLLLRHVVLPLFLTVALVGVTWAQLPPGCTNLHDEVLSSVDPRTIFPESSELGTIASPRRIGAFRQSKALPTHSFAMNQAKHGGFEPPIKTEPYTAFLNNEGVAYDAYTLDRWSDPERTDEMTGQTPSEEGAPWNKLTQLGTDMRQVAIGPDGNKFGAAYTGRSGIRVSIPESADPMWEDFTENSANFMFQNEDGGSMEASIVRGAPLLTHIITNANPTLTPYCLSSVNGQTASYPCPMEGGYVDGGEGFLEGSCSGSTLHIILRTTKVVELGLVQHAAVPMSSWPPGMTSCGPECELSEGGKRVDIYIEGASGQMGFAVNVIGKFIIPNDWVNDPMTASCFVNQPFYAPDQSPAYEPMLPVVVEPEVTASAVPDPAFCLDIPSTVTCTSPFCQHTFCQANPEDGSQQDVKIVFKLEEPLLGGVEDLEIAISNSADWPVGMQRCTSEFCSISSDGKEITYCRIMPEGGISFAVNVIGRFVRPTSDWQVAPYMYQCGGQGQDLGSGRKFVLELDEPGDALPQQTRKYVAYFSSDVQASLGAGGISFTPSAGGNYNGIVQLGYLGSGARGDTSGDDFYEPYQGVFSYEPELSFCADGDTGYMNFDWNKHDENGPTGSGNLLMIAYPHHWPLLESQGSLIDTPFGFKGFVGDNWLMEEDLPRASMEPIPEAVDGLTEAERNDIVDALDRDLAGAVIEETCDEAGSYWAGKDIGMAARAASISRAFGTDHYVQLDAMVLGCMDRWLRVNDTLEPGDQFLYDSLMGGTWARNVPEDEPLDPYANFGFPVFADHHFHLGYWVYAAGYLAKNYPDWAQDRRERIMLLARDIGNPSPLDSWYPVVRHKDWFLGLSWATGPEGGARQEESSTESINAYHGLAALGEALGDPVLQATGQITLATEIRAVREYFHVREHNRERFPPLIQSYGAIGMFTDEIFSYALNWPCAPNLFPMRHACLIGIQVIPVLSVSHLYMDAEWADSVKQVCGWANDPWSAPGSEIMDPDLLEPVKEGWGEFCALASAPASQELADEAADMIRGKGPEALVSGSGEASSLLFIYGRS